MSAQDIRMTATVRAILFALLPALIVAVYWPALSGPFLLDDVSNLSRSRPDAFGIAALLEVAGNNRSGSFGRPIPALTFGLNFLFGAEGPTAFKVTNLALHVVNTFLVYVFCRTVLLSCELGKGGGATRRRSARTIALIVAAAWALHPLQVSTVMYIVQRMTLMACGFTLISLTLYMTMRYRQIERDERSLIHLPLIALFTLLACLSKENGALVLPQIALIESLIFRFRTRSDAGRRSLVSGLAIFVALPMALAGLYFAANSARMLEGYAIRDFDMIERLLTQPAVVLLYLKMALLPSLSDMSFYHDAFPIRRALDLSTLLEAGAIVSLAALVPILHLRAPLLAYGIGFFLVSHLLESTFLPLEIAFEHRNYIGMIGLLLPLLTYATRLSVGRVRIAATALLAICLLSIPSLQTRARALEWSSALSLNAVAAQSRPESVRAGTTLAVVLAQSGRTDEALRQLELVSRSVPREAYPHLLSLHIRALSGNEPDDLVEDVRQVLASGRVGAEVGQLLENMHDTRSRGDAYLLETAEVVSFYEAALSNPDKRLGRDHMGALHARKAAMLTELGRLADATASLEVATSLNPRNEEIRLRLAERLAADGTSRRAAELARGILEHPGDADAEARARAVLVRTGTR